MGTDPNRNFDFQWATVGSSDQPCSETFHGSEPFSEVEHGCQMAIARF